MVKNDTRIQQEPVLYTSNSPPFNPFVETTLHKLYITENASKELFKHTSWGNVILGNSIEQGGILLGAICHDEYTDVNFGYVQNIVPLPEASIAPKSIPKKSWRDFFESMFRQYANNDKLNIIGFYHTLPGVKKIQPTFDYNILKSFFLDDVFFSVILDPHNMQWKSYRGYKQRECQGFIFLPQDKNDLFEIRNMPKPVETVIEAPKPFTLSFTIIKKNELVVERTTADKLTTDYGIPPDDFNSLNSENVLILTTNAQKRLAEHIAWGRKSYENIVEQGGLLIGTPFQVNDNFISVADTIIYTRATSSNAAYLNMGHDTWGKMLSEYDEKYADDGQKIVGWYHTHPNSLSVFMSGTDMGTQRKFFNKEWHFSLVLNPHRKLMKAFYSANAVECKMITLKPEKE